MGPARLARAVLPRVRLGPVRADARRSGQRRPGLHHRAGRPDRRAPAGQRSAPPPTCCRAAARARARSPARTRRTTADADEDQSGFPWLPVGGGTAGALLVVGLLLLPRTAAAAADARPRRRRTRGRVGRSCATPRSTCGSRGRRTGHRARPATGWSTTSARRSTDDTPERPRHGADVAPEAVHRAGPDRAGRRAAALRARPRRRPTPVRCGPSCETVRRLAARRRHAACPAAGGLVAAVGAEP